MQQYFHEVSLPSFLAIYAKGGPYFQTMVASTISGREVRNAPRTHSLQKYEIRDCKLTTEQFSQLNTFFRARRGMMYGFRLRDYADCKVTNQLIATGDNQFQQFQLFKRYQDQNYIYLRTIQKPIRNTVKLRVDSQEITAFKVDHNTGQSTLESVLAEGKTLTASFEFEVPVRFNNDYLSYQFSEDGSILIDKLELIEVVL